MAQRRMIHKQISLSEQVSNLPVTAQLIFTWMIPHADDVGLLTSSKKSLRFTVVPMLDLSQQEFNELLEQIVLSKLLDVFEYKGERFYRITSFSKYQTLQRDRKPISLSEHIKDWSTVDSIWKPNTSNSIPTVIPSEEKLVKVTLNKVNKSEDNISPQTNRTASVKEILNENQYIHPSKYDINGPDEYAALEIWTMFEPLNKRSFYTTYLPAAQRGVSADVMYQFASEIKQDKTIISPGKVFLAKVKTYLSIK